MFTVHVLKSLENGKRYVGHTSKDVFLRLSQHNTGHNKWTRVNKPFKIVYTEEFEDKTKAKKARKVFKIWSGKKIP